MYEQDVNSSQRGPNGSDADESAVKEKALLAAGAARDGTQEVAGTVKEQGREVAREARYQARSVASDLRSSATRQAHSQNQRLAAQLRQASEQFGQMGPEDDSPAGQIVRRLGEGGRRAADYLEDRGPEGLLDDVQEFARRKPGTFLLIAAAAGFAVGRLGRAALSASQDDGKSSGPDAYRETDGLYRSRSAGENLPAGRYGSTAPLTEPLPPAPAYPPATEQGYQPGVEPVYQPGTER